LDAVGTFAGLANVVGLTREESVEFGTTLTDLAADLASFGDTSVDEAVLALGSALRGESEPIRRYGVMLDDATLRKGTRGAGDDSTSGVRDSMEQIQKFGARREKHNVGPASSVLGIVPNKFMARTKNHRANIALLSEDYPGMVWNPITHGTKWSEAQNFSKLIWAYAPGGREANEASAFVRQAMQAVAHE
jgi:hypothetical protein